MRPHDVPGLRVPTKRAQVRHILSERISADLGPGDPIPSERVLVRDLGVSRVTVRQAISDLVEAGRLERVHGKGTFVSGPQVNSRLHLTSFSREMRARGLVPETQVIEGREEDASPEVARQLQVRARDSVIRVERLRLADGTPMAYEIGYYPSAIFPGLLDLDLNTLYDVFASRFQVIITSGDQTVRAEAADAHQAHVLGTTRRAPLLVQERLTRAGDRPIEFSTSWYRADRYRIHMAIRPLDTPGSST